MGRRGPTPTPTKVKMLRGETRPSRLNLREPMPSADVPKIPADMDAEAKVVWRRVLRDMRHTGVIRAADADVLRCYCEAVSRYAQAARLYAQSGPITKRDGNLVKNPLHLPASEVLPALDRDLDVLRIDLHRVAAPTQGLGRHEGRA
jgi:P27 family predicted phage terminase small subunit